MKFWKTTKAKMLLIKSLICYNAPKQAWWWQNTTKIEFNGWKHKHDFQLMSSKLKIIVIIVIHYVQEIRQHNLNLLILDLKTFISNVLSNFFFIFLLSVFSNWSLDFFFLKGIINLLHSFNGIIPRTLNTTVSNCSVQTCRLFRESWLFLIFLPMPFSSERFCTCSLMRPMEAAGRLVTHAFARLIFSHSRKYKDVKQEQQAYLGSPPRDH